jgi:hypothetical protein
VTIVDLSIPQRRLDERFDGRVDTRVSTRSTIADLADADLVIGSVLVPGAAAPKLVTLDMVERMRRARCSWTSRSTRVAASRARMRPRTPIRPTGCTTPSTTPLPTCRERCR